MNKILNRPFRHANNISIKMHSIPEILHEDKPQDFKFKKV